MKAVMVIGRGERAIDEYFDASAHREHSLRDHEKNGPLRELPKGNSLQPETISNYDNVIYSPTHGASMAKPKPRPPPETLSRDDEAGRADPSVLFHEERALSQAGGGLAVYLPAGVRKELGLSFTPKRPKGRRSRAEPSVLTENVARIEYGRLVLQVRPKLGVGPDDLLRLAGEEGWKILDRRIDGPQSWFVLLRTPVASLRADAWTHVRDRPLNNISLATDALRIREVEQFERLRTLARDNGFQLGLEDSEGLWTRSQLSLPALTQPQEIQAVARLLAISKVTARFQRSWHSPSARLEEVRRAARAVEGLFQKATDFTKPPPEEPQG